MIANLVWGFVLVLGLVIGALYAIGLKQGWL